MPSSLAVQSPAVLSAARDFARRVALAWPLQSAMLFGSQARGNAHVGSDTDVAVLLHGKPILGKGHNLLPAGPDSASRATDRTGCRLVKLRP